MSADFTDLDLTGRKIREYELLRRIGVGGMGVVYEGRHPVIGKRVAVKFLLSTFSKDKDLVERFKAEARAVNEIGHRGIVDIFDFGALDDGTQYFVMELLDGRPFDKVISIEAPMHPAIAIRYLEEILDALAAAHAAGVIHRDIKPSNIFLVEGSKNRPYIKVLDFGIAKVNAQKTGTTPQTRQSVVIGTPEYIAPEQAQGKAVGAGTDLYAVGCVAYELLTGKLPFRGENPLDTMFKHVVEPTPRVSALVPSMPRALDDLVFRLMAKRQEDRPASAHEVVRLLEGARGGYTLDASPAAPAPAGPELAEAFAHTVRSVPSLKVPVAGEPQPNTAEALAVVRRPGPMRQALLGLAAVAVGGAAVFAFTRPGPPPLPLVEPPPPRVVEVPKAAIDAGAVAVVVVPPKNEPVDAGARPVVKKGISAAQLSGRIAALERKLEQREVQRGEANRVLRAFLKQARDDAANAKTDADRRQVWIFLDELARQLEQ